MRPFGWTHIGAAHESRVLSSVPTGPTARPGRRRTCRPRGRAGWLSSPFARSGPSSRPTHLTWLKRSCRTAIFVRSISALGQIFSLCPLARCATSWPLQKSRSPNHAFVPMRRSCRVRTESIQFISVSTFHSPTTFNIHLRSGYGRLKIPDEVILSYDGFHIDSAPAQTSLNHPLGTTRRTTDGGL